MYRYISIVFLIFFLSSINFAFSQQVNAEQIIQNLYMQATLGKIQDMVIDMDIFGPGGNTGEAKNEAKKLMTARAFFSYPCKIRVEKTVIIEGAQSDVYAVVIRDGRLEWTFTPNTPFPIAKKEDTHYHSNFFPFNTDTQPQDQYRKYTLIGQDKMDERDVYIIGINNEKDPTSRLITVWIDAERFVALKEETSVKLAEDKETKYKIMYKNIQQLPDGRWMPFKIERYENNKLLLTMTLKNIAVNVGLPANLFNPEIPH